MKAWVFNEAQLEEALDRWLANRFGGDDIITKQVRDDFEDFLHSPEAAKLRVGQLDQGNGQA